LLLLLLEGNDSLASASSDEGRGTGNIFSDLEADCIGVRGNGETLMGKKGETADYK